MKGDASRNRNFTGALLGLTMVLASGGLANVGTGPARETPSVADGSRNPRIMSTAERLLARLVIEEEPPRRGYARTKFPHWSDLDGDGCSTREQVLIDEAEDGTAVDCAMEGGEWFSIYDADVVNSASDLDIDHFVPLAESWDSGASSWDRDRRERFANDLGYEDSLVAVTASSNRSKGDQDPAEWTPPTRTIWCRYATAWTTVKIRWSLNSDDFELQALREMFQTCRKPPSTDVPIAD